MTSTYSIIQRDFRDHRVDRYLSFFDEPVDVDFENMTDEERLEYFSLKNTFKKIGDTIGDIGKGVVKLSVAPINAVTGHEYDPRMSSKIGKALEWAGDAAEDAQTGLYGLNTPTETKIGAAIGTVAGQVIKYVPIAGQVHMAVTPLLKNINNQSLGIDTTYTEPVYEQPAETLEDKIRANIVPIAGGTAFVIALLIVIVAVR